MDAAYLQSTVGPLLAEGLAATLLRNPPDKVEFLAHWLRKSVEEKAVLAARAQTAAALAAADAEAETVAAAAAAQSARAAASRDATDAEREGNFDKLLATAASADALLPAFLQFLRSLTGASSAYIGLVQPADPAAADGGDAGRSLKYVAATPDNEWLLDKRLDEKKGKVTFELFGEEPEEEEEEPEEEDEHGNPIPRAKKEKDPRSVFVPNVLLGGKSASMHFWKLPKLGSYLAVKLAFPAAVADETLDEAVEREGELLAMKKEQDEEKARAKKEAEDEARREAGLDVDEDEERSGSDQDEDEDSEDDSSARRSRRAASKKAESKSDEADEGAESESEEDRESREKAEEESRLAEEEEFLLAHLTRPPTEYALCLDTLGQNRRFSEEQVALAVRYAKALQTKLAALDRALFSQERKRRLALVEFQREVAELNEQGSLRSDEEKAEELERLSDELEAVGRPNADEDVLFKYRGDLLLSPQLKPQLAAFTEMAVFPRGNLAVVQAVLFLLGYDKNQVVDADGRPDWKRMRVLFTDDFFARLRDYDPRQTSHDSVPAERRYTESVAVGKLVSELVYEEIKEKNYVLSELLLWVREALAVKRRAKAERAKLARDEARKKAAAEAAEAAEAERKAAEEEEAARIAAGGEPNEGDEEEAESEEED